MKSQTPAIVSNCRFSKRQNASASELRNEVENTAGLQDLSTYRWHYRVLHKPSRYCLMTHTIPIPTPIPLLPKLWKLLGRFSSDLVTMEPLRRAEVWGLWWEILPSMEDSTFYGRFYLPWKVTHRTQSLSPWSIHHQWHRCSRSGVLGCQAASMWCITG